ncbi:Tn3 family transposase [Deinococcus aluminii]|uniref:Tn3 family transposase ISSod9 n=1 Tax=Deinococcus aluminii TaxID=1656885 RepID=A0ABP9XFK6_9DEIO
MQTPPRTPQDRPPLLTAAQRQQFTRFPDLDERLLSRYYLLSEDELALIHQRRRDSNRLGYAVQLTVLRHLGRGLSGGEKPPDAILVFLAEQLHIDPAQYEHYAAREPTRREHFGELCALLGYQPLSLDLNREIRQWLVPIAVATDQPFPLMSALLDELRRRKILIPRIGVLERIVTAARTQADRSIYRVLGEVAQGREADLDALLVTPPDQPLSPYARLKQPAGRVRPSTLLRLLDRLGFVRSFPVRHPLLASLPQNRLDHLAAEGKRLGASNLADYEPSRRRATILARLIDLSQTLTDDILEMHDRLMLSYLRESEREGMAVFQEQGKTVLERLRTFQQVCEALVEAREQEADPFRAVEAVLPWSTLVATVRDTEAAEQAGQLDPMHHLLKSYPKVRSYAVKLLQAFEFRAAPAAEPLLEALGILRTLYQDGKRTLPAKVPLRFVRQKWAPFVIEEGQINRRYYELCVLDELRLALRAGDIWVEGSRKYRDLDEYLLPQDAWAARLAELPLNLPETFDAYWQDTLSQLTERLETVSALLEKGELTDVSMPKGRLRITPLKNTVPPEVEPLTRQVAARLPRLKITDLLLEVDGWTRFSEAFTDLRTGRTAERRDHLLTVLLADGLNLGLTKMAEASQDEGVTARRLMHLSDWFIRPETYSAALAELVNFQTQQSLAKHWGDGTTSSSDGQRFATGGRGKAHGHLNAKYGREPGVLFYTHVSDQYAPFHTKAITTNVRDALHVLDGLLYHQSNLVIREHYTDTAGYTEQVFALCHLLGFRFAPRIRDLGETRLYTPETAGGYPVLEPLIARKLNLDLIRANWDELRRLTVSVRLGTVTASLLMSKLASYPRQNSLALALRELGRVQRTLFTLEWLLSPELRRRVNAGLNKGEARNALARAVSFHRSGEIRDRSAEAQNNRANGVNLLVALITTWNTVYLDRTVEALRAEGQTIPEDLLTHLSPLGWDHIGLTGDYLWRLEQVPKPGEFRPLKS